MTAVDPASAARAYYRALDEGEYATLADLLAPGFVQYRPDRTFEGRDAFVAFVRDDRPMTDTSHEVHEIVADGDRASVRGTLLDGDGEAVFEFADFHTLDEHGQIGTLHTYIR